MNAVGTSGHVAGVNKQIVIEDEPLEITDRGLRGGQKYKRAKSAFQW
jgi:hypothetical protein